MPKTLAKTAAASRGPRQFSAARSSERFSDMVEQLPLTLAVRRDRRWRHRVKPIPNAIEQPQAAAQCLGNLNARLDSRLRAPSPAASELIEIFAIRAIAANRQPFALRQSSQQGQVRRTQCQPQLAFSLEALRQREPFVLRTLTRYRRVAEVGQGRHYNRKRKLGSLPAPPKPKEQRSQCQGHYRY